MISGGVKMRKTKAFTLIEVMVSIFVFSIAMVGYMTFHAHSMSVLFDNESSQFAHTLAFNLIDELNAMSADSFKKFVDDSNTLNSTKKDSEITPTLFSNDFKKGPFTISDGDGYKFVRTVSIERYTDKTQSYAPDDSYLSTLYHVEVGVYWPKRGYGNIADCYEERGNTAACNSLTIPIVRSNRAY